MKKLTKKEQIWVDRVEKLLMNPPSKRIGLFTIGDSDLRVYDRSLEEDIDNLMDKRGIDFCSAVDELDAGFGFINADMSIHSTSG